MDGASDIAEDEAAVRAVESAYDVAWNAGDISAVLNLLTDRIVITNPSGETTVGRDEAASTFAALMDGPARGSKHNSEVVAVRFVNSDVALVDGLASINGFGGRAAPLRHNYTDILVRTADGWRIDQVRAYVFMQLPDYMARGCAGQK